MTRKFLAVAVTAARINGCFAINGETENPDIALATMEIALGDPKHRR